MRGAAPGVALHNGYGPTECTTFTCTHRIDDVPAGATSIPIGRPIADTSVYILNSRGEPVPTGVVGELHVGGEGVARGYLGRTDLTARSEEHTSELQSLMRTSYAVFCLKKKTTKHQ